MNSHSSSKHERRRSWRTEAKLSRPKGLDPPLLHTDAVSASSFPAFECFAAHISESSAISNFERSARVGDEIIVKVKKFDAAGAYVKAICFASRIKRDLEWLDYQLLAPLSSFSRRLSVGEFIKARITEVNPIKIVLTEVPPIKFDDLPEYFRVGSTMSSKTQFWKFLQKRKDFGNPYLVHTLGFPTCSKMTFLPLENFELDCLDTAALMRRQQDEELAMESVHRGVEEMKGGNISGALQQFDHALNIYPKCVDAFVARGAAYSNQAMYNKAEDDFEKALSLQPEHTNAKAYMVETLLKHAGLLEIENDRVRTREMYERVLKIKEDRRARLGIERIDKRKRTPSPDHPAKNRKIDVIEKPKNKPSVDSYALRLQREKERKKLEEMEAFIASLKNGK